MGEALDRIVGALFAGRDRGAVICRLAILAIGGVVVWASACAFLMMEPLA